MVGGFGSLLLLHGVDVVAVDWEWAVMPVRHGWYFGVCSGSFVWGCGGGRNGEERGVAGVSVGWFLFGVRWSEHERVRVWAWSKGLCGGVVMGAG